jgi:kynurenine formamidase
MPIVEGMPFNPDHFPPEITRYAEIDTRGWRATTLLLDSHLGTHIDAPSHFLPNGIHLDQVPLEQLVGPAQVVRLPGLREGEAISADRLPSIERPRILLATDWWRHADDPELYFRRFPYLSEAAAASLLHSGVRLVGIDGPSVDYDGKTHILLLSGGSVIVENLLHLDQIPDLCFISILPLPIVGGDGSPVRAIAEILDGTHGHLP